MLKLQFVHSISSLTWTMCSSVMSRNASTDHLTRTSDNFRSNETIGGTIVSIDQLTASVKGFTISSEWDPETSFSAGQWLDLFIPGVDTVGGFTICSPPSRWTADRTLQLAVKQADHPPAEWLHSKAVVGSPLSFRFGGSFYLDTTNCPSDLLLIAGGVGINPFRSMVEEWIHHRRAAHGNNPTDGWQARKVILLYAAKCEQDLLFMDDFKAMEEQNCGFEIRTFCSDSVKGRINLQDIELAMKELAVFDMKCFLCGPPPMIDSMQGMLPGLGLTQNQILFEKWW